MDKVNLGELQINRGTWVRGKVSLDHVRCLVNDLVNGSTFPPLIVDKATKTVVGGNHRYMAYKQYHGNNWEAADVSVEWISLPPFDTDPVAWYAAALDDNRHLTERLGYSDRNLTAAAVLKSLGSGDDPQAKEISRLLHYTSQGWQEFSALYLQSLVAKLAQEKPVSEEPAEGTQEDRVVTRAPGGGATRKTKHTINDIQPSDAKMDAATPRAQLIAKSNGLIHLLSTFPPGAITPKEQATLDRLVLVIQELLAKVA